MSHARLRLDLGGDLFTRFLGGTSAPLFSDASDGQPRLLLLTNSERNYHWAAHLLRAAIPRLRVWFLREFYRSENPPSGEHWSAVSDMEDPGRLKLALEDVRFRFGDVDRVVALDEFGVLPAAWIRESLGLEGETEAEVLPLRDKQAMYELARANGVPTVRRVGRDELSGWDFRTPLAAKAPAGAGSVDVCKVHSLEEAEKILERSHQDHLFEEWIDAPVCHVDGVAMDHRIAFASASRYVDSCFDFVQGRGFGSYTLSEGTDRDRFIRAAQEVVSALRVPNGAFHIELFDTLGGPVLLEAAARPPGGPIPNIVAAATGVDLFAEHIRKGMGDRNRVQRTRSGSAGYWILPKRADVDAKVHAPDVNVESVTPRPRLRSNLIESTLVRPGEAGVGEALYTDPLAGFVIEGAGTSEVVTDLLALRNGVSFTFNDGHVVGGEPGSEGVSAPSIAVALREIALDSGYLDPGWAFTAVPTLVDEDRFVALSQSCGELFTLLCRIPHLLYDGDWMAFAAAVGASEEELAVLRCLPVPSPGQDTTVFSLRWDFVFTDDGPRLFEVNAGITLGGLAEEGIQSAYDHFADVAEGVVRMPGAVLAEALQRRTGPWAPGDKVALVEAETYADDPFPRRQLASSLAPYTDAEFVLCRAFEVDFSGTRTTVRGEVVDHCVELFALSELATEEALAPYVRAVREGRRSSTVSMWCDVLGSKAALALLHRCTDQIGVDEARLVRELIPRVDLLRDLREDELRDRRRELVLKPGRELGGAGVVAGSEVDGPEWSRRCAELRSDPAAVVQERVKRTEAMEQVWVRPEGGVRAGMCRPVLGLFSFSDEPAGGVSRGAVDDAVVVNARTGAGVGVLRVRPQQDKRIEGGSL